MCSLADEEPIFKKGGISSMDEKSGEEESEGLKMSSPV